MNLLSLLTEASVALQRYAIDGAILIKSVAVLPVTVQNEHGGEAFPLLLQINKMGEVLPLT